MNKKRNTKLKKLTRVSFDMVILSLMLFAIYVGLSNINMIIQDRSVYLNHEIRVIEIEKTLKSITNKKENVVDKSHNIE